MFKCFVVVIGNIICTCLVVMYCLDNDWLAFLDVLHIGKNSCNV